MILGPATMGFLAARGVIAPHSAHPAPAMLTAQAGRPPQPVKQPIRDIAAAAVPQAAVPQAAPPAQNAQTQNAQARVPSASGANDPATTPASVNAIPPCDKPNGIGLSRIVQVDTTGGPEFGFQHRHGYEFLRDKEVVLTFDDGPAPRSTPVVLQALADTCLKAIFFEIGEQAKLHPEVTRQVIEAGMTVGTHTWSHKDLARNPYAKDIGSAQQEVEMGISAVHWAAAGGSVAPFFRFPDLQDSALLLSYFAERNIAVFSTDIDSRDFTMHKPEQVVDSVMRQLDKRGKGIILMHDLHLNTARALPDLLQRLKAGGYKIVHLMPQEALATIPKYDDLFEQNERSAFNNIRR